MWLRTEHRPSLHATNRERRVARGTRPPVSPEIFTQRRIYIQPLGIRDPPHLSCCHARDPPRDAALAEFTILFLQQAEQRPVDVAKTEQAEIVGAND
jgi:hypothetical protein